MSTIKLFAADISCEHCERRITQALGELDGVRSVAVDIGAKTVEVDIDDSVVTEETVRSALVDAGYPTEP
jgi:copper chaperone CopZ